MDAKLYINCNNFNHCCYYEKFQELLIVSVLEKLKLVFKDKYFSKNHKSSRTFCGKNVANLHLSSPSI